MLIDPKSSALGTRTDRIGARLAALLSVAAFALQFVHAQEVLHQEGFNDDGSKASPPHYTITGASHYEVSEFNADNGVPNTQLGPVYWAHNFEVSFVGVPGPTPARRAILAWDGAIAADAITPEMGKVLDATFK